MTEGNLSAVSAPQSPEACVLRLEGPADISAAKRLLATARDYAAGEGDVVVDGSKLTRLDGAGVQILLALKKALASAGRAFRIESVPERTFALLLVSGAGQELVASPSTHSSRAPSIFVGSSPEPAAADEIIIETEAEAETATAAAAAAETDTAWDLTGHEPAEPAAVAEPQATTDNDEEV